VCEDLWAHSDWSGYKREGRDPSNVISAWAAIGMHLVISNLHLGALSSYSQRADDLVGVAGALIWC
jgi:hypothetical protein